MPIILNKGRERLYYPIAKITINLLILNILNHFQEGEIEGKNSSGI
jgi:hypothetical protein